MALRPLLTRAGTLRNGVIPVALLAICVQVIPSGAVAQGMASAVPGLSGVWDRRGIVGETRPMQLTARAIGFGQAFDEVLSPRYDCSPAAAPFIIRDPYNFSVEQLEDRVLLRYEKDDVLRTVWLRGFEHPEPGPYDFTIQGHSVGWYEGDRLIVETTKFVFDPIGLANTGNVPSSTLKKVTERYWRDGNSLMAEVTTEDPLILSEPYAFRFRWELTEVGLESYDCDPELARFPARFQPSNYRDPDWVRLPSQPPTVNP
ncbi:MAG: hypothetical protein F4053_10585 [Proteobacteria bacterium]|nr:hypothetical protein [Pseudomonadota bacterium]MYJ96003.1 hypothetical protein [Pseudomonadota bacterium]